MAFKPNSARSSLRKSISLLMAICIVFTMGPIALAASVGSIPSSVVDSAVKSFVKPTSAIEVFTETTKPSSGTVSVSSGTVLMLVSTDTYTVTDGTTSTEYGCLYFNNKRYNVVWADVSGAIMSTSDVSTYVTGTLWAPATYPSLKKADSLLGNVQVYALQMALSTLNYYSVALDGEYGEKTQTAVKSFQSANSLTVDGNAGPLTLKVLYPLALAAYSGTSSSGTTSSSGILKTTLSLNLRKSYSTDSARLAIVPAKTSLSYTKTAVSGGATWYYVIYANTYGWLMGTYVTISSSGSSSTSTTIGTLATTANVNLRNSSSTKGARLSVVPSGTTLAYTKTATSGGVTWYYVTYSNLSGWLMGTYVRVTGTSTDTTTTGIGTVTITAANTRVRTSPNGSKSGYVLSKGSKVTLLAAPTTAGGYTWYYIRTSSGLKGYVRGDCASVSYDAGGGITPSTTKVYVQLGKDVTLFTSEETSTTGAVTVGVDTVLQMVSTETYTKNTVVYCSLYYNNNKYNCVYSDVSGDIMTSAELTTYITGTLWPLGYITKLKEDLGQTGDINVHSLQYALTLLGYYTGALDGNFGSGTTSGVRNFQRKYSLTVDGSVGPETAAVLYPKAIAALTGTSNTDFGTIIDITKPSWNFGDDGGSLFPKSATATVMDIGTQLVFKVKRWAGADHADCVPLTAADTKTMCDIIGFPYNSSHPSSSQLKQIIADESNNNSTYTWPDFHGAWTTKTWNSGAWDRRPALLNYNGHVYAVSIYGWPHGYNGTSSVCGYADSNNYYGMMCIHFLNSKTHGTEIVDTQHQANVLAAYNWAKAKWPTLTK
ncbi:MAG: peptidoglycan-binding protein [Eubacteriales bacterium]|nr:peptidoglycan-binding protein [Eubacteriales bacterium]